VTRTRCSPAPSADTWTRARYGAATPPAVKDAELRPLPFHSLRHYFGSMAVNRASLVQVQSWMGHSHIQTTARYLHAKSQAGDAALLAGAFAATEVDPVGAERG
jgi:integrase